VTARRSASRSRAALSRPLGHRSQSAREHADLVPAFGREVDVQPVEIDAGRAIGEVRDGTADPRRHPSREKHRE
jgi:hypothetical protein